MGPVRRWKTGLEGLLGAAPPSYDVHGGPPQQWKLPSCWNFLKQVRRGRLLLPVPGNVDAGPQRPTASQKGCADGSSVVSNVKLTREDLGRPFFFSVRGPEELRSDRGSE